MYTLKNAAGKFYVGQPRGRKPRGYLFRTRKLAEDHFKVSGSTVDSADWAATIVDVHSYTITLLRNDFLFVTEVFSENQVMLRSLDDMLEQQNMDKIEELRNQRLGC